MLIKSTYDIDFDSLWRELKLKYPEVLFTLSGVGEEQLDTVKFTNEFFTNKVADTSVDPNSNIRDKSATVYAMESDKPKKRLDSLHELYVEAKDKFGKEIADNIIEMQIRGDIYINDLHGIISGLPYCFNYTTYDIMTQGLSMVTTPVCSAPKYLLSFKSQLEQFVAIASNSTLGATGLADLLVVMSYYVNNALIELKDDTFNFKSTEDVWAYVKSLLTSFIYTVNQPYRCGIQSPFTNISLYDSYFLEELKEDYLFPDGTNPDINIVMKLQELFIDVMNSEMDRTPITYPVTSVCISKDENNEVRDEKFLDMISEKNLKYGFMNIFSGATSQLSSCCFDGEQKTLTKSSNGVNYMSFESLYNSSAEETRRNFTIFHNGSWCKGKLTKVNKKGMYCINTSNNKRIKVTEDHLNPTLRGDIRSDELTENDYLLCSNIPIETYPNKDLKLTYEQGILIGAYLGDGSIYERKDNNGVSVHYSLNEDKYNKLLPLIKKGLKDCGIETSINLSTPYNNVYPVNINSIELKDFIKEWTNGNYCNEKEVNLNCILQSMDFRKGIVDGLYLTDGGNSNRIYTTSTKLIEQLEVIFTSLGLNTIIDESDRTDEKVVIRGKECKRNHVLYCIRWYEMKNKRSMSNVYIVKNNSVYFKIKDICKYDNNNEYVYCFEMKNIDEPYFTLPNGIITHNCRLRSDKNNEYFNSFGSGSSKIGSLGVCTINLPRLAYIYSKKDYSLFQDRLKYLTRICARVNECKRNIIKRRIESECEPLYSLGFMDINRQYSTVGVNGFNECIEILDRNILEQDGVDTGLDIINIINTENDKMEGIFHAPHNCEQIPGETVSIKLAEKDRILGYNDRYEMYSNQFIPLINYADMFDRINLQGVYDKHFSGGSIMHLNVENRIEDKEQMKNLIRTSIKKGVQYFAINYNIQMCEDGHISIGRGKICRCGKPIVSNFTRVVGFVTNTKDWHYIRQTFDYLNRKFYGGIEI